MVPAGRERLISVVHRHARNVGDSALALRGAELHRKWKPVVLSICD